MYGCSVYGQQEQGDIKGYKAKLTQLLLKRYSIGKRARHLNSFFLSTMIKVKFDKSNLLNLFNLM